MLDVFEALRSLKLFIELIDVSDFILGEDFLQARMICHHDLLILVQFVKKRVDFIITLSLFDFKQVVEVCDLLALQIGVFWQNSDFTHSIVELLDLLVGHLKVGWLAERLCQVVE